MELRSVRDYDWDKSGGHCVKRFPQFSVLDATKVAEVLRRVIDSPSDYFKRVYKDWQEQLALYEECLKAPNAQVALAMLLDYKARTGNSVYVSYDAWLGLDGQTILLFEPCCR